MKIVDAIIPEPAGGAHADPEAAMALVGDAVEAELKALDGLSVAELKARRAERFYAIGRNYAYLRLRERVRQRPGSEQDHRVLVIVAHLGVGGGREGDDRRAQRTQALGLAAGFLRRLAADLLLSLQRLAASLNVGLDDVDGFPGHGRSRAGSGPGSMAVQQNRSLTPG
jgi:hypothetical protein